MEILFTLPLDLLPAVAGGSPGMTCHLTKITQTADEHVLVIRLRVYIADHSDFGAGFWPALLIMQIVHLSTEYNRSVIKYYIFSFSLNQLPI